MLVCWEWLQQYVELDVSPEEMANRFAMSGLNHESTEQVGSDVVVDLEVTSNRGDCLGHIGVAREAAVLLQKPLRIPEAKLQESSVATASLIAIENRFPEACPQYTARILRGVKVGPSPAWLVRRLNAIGINSVNNVVDVTNYVMMECGQPLHAFDLEHIRGSKIIVRPAAEKEQFLAIDHRTYELDAQMVVIADAERAVALGGVMGGAESEVSESTTDVLIEAASFSSMAIRRAARKLKLHSPSSFRFERSPDPHALDWASRRCCELIMEVAGGTVTEGVVSCGTAPESPSAISFRLAQLPRILGIDVPKADSIRILTDLGCKVTNASSNELQVLPPTWRPDLSRELDLVEEIARIYGYEEIPETAMVPMSVAESRPKDLVLKRLRHVMSAYGIDEAMTPSVVNESLEACGSVWTNVAPLHTETPLLVGSRLLRRSLVPSLLACRYTNQTQAIRNAQLYEVSTVFLPNKDAANLPSEQSTLGFVTAGDLRFLKGVAEEVLAQVAPKNASFEWSCCDHPMFQPGTAQKISVGEAVVGWIGLVSPGVQEALSLDQICGAAEISVDVLTELVVAVRTADPISLFPAVTRDLNFIVSESLTWAELSQHCRQSGGDSLQAVKYQETYRDPKKDGAERKRILISLHFQRLDRTLTGDEVDASVKNIIDACLSKFDAKLLS